MSAVIELLKSHRSMLIHLGYQAISSESVAEALSLYEASPESFDVVVTDYSMPEKNGLDLLRTCRTFRSNQSGVIITGGGYTLPEKGFLRLSKPVKLSELAETIQVAVTLGNESNQKGPTPEEDKFNPSVS